MQANKYTNTTKEYKKKLSQNYQSDTQIPDSDLNNNNICFQQAFIYSPVVWLLIDPITGDIVDTNTAASKFYGYSIAELRSKKIFEISTSSAKKTKIFLLGISDNIQRPCVCQHKLRSGQIKDVNIYSSSFESGDKRVISLMVIDITAKRKAKEKLKQSQQRLALALDGSNAGIWDLDVVNKTIFCDQRYLKMLGYEAQGIGNHQVSWQEFCHPDDIVHVKEAVHDYLAGRIDRFEGEWRWKHKDGTYRWIFSTGKVVYDNKNHPIHLLGLSFDITHKKRLQAAYEIERRSIVLNDILNGISCLDQDNMVYGKSLGLDFAQPLLCCVINIESPVTDELNQANDYISQETLNHKIITELSNTAGCVLWECRSKIGVLYQVKQTNNEDHSIGSSLARSLQKKINSYHPDIIATIGIGETQQETSGFKKSFQQAWEAVSIAQGSSKGINIVHFLDLGILQLLVKQANKSYAPEFVDRTIGKLIQYDIGKRTDYLDTLEAILQNSNLKVTAKLLFLHYNTIVFRKKRIEKILGTSISEFEMKLTLATAIKLYKLNLQNQHSQIK